MSKEVIEIFDYIGEKLGIAIDWTQENIIPYLTDLLERYVTFNIVIHAIGLFLGIAGAVGAIVMLTHIYFRADRAKSIFWELGSYQEKILSFGGAGATIISGFIGLLSLFALIYNPVELLEWIFIPEFQIIEDLTYYISTL
jgi:hypothetical protein